MKIIVEVTQSELDGIGSFDDDDLRDEITEELSESFTYTEYKVYVKIVDEVAL